MTGGAGGIGRATAELLIAEGARVVLADVRRDALDEALGRIANVNAFAVPLDAASPASLAAVGHVQLVTSTAKVVRVAPAYIAPLLITNSWLGVFVVLSCLVLQLLNEGNDVLNELDADWNAWTRYIKVFPEENLTDVVRLIAGFFKIKAEHTSVNNVARTRQQLVEEGFEDLPRISEVATGVKAPTMKRFLPISRRFRSLSSRYRAMVVTMLMGA